MYVREKSTRACNANVDETNHVQFRPVWGKSRARQVLAICCVPQFGACASRSHARAADQSAAGAARHRIYAPDRRACAAPCCRLISALHGAPPANHHHLAHGQTVDEPAPERPPPPAGAHGPADLVPADRRWHGVRPAPPFSPARLADPRAPAGTTRRTTSQGRSSRKRVCWRAPRARSLVITCA
jgi:hypothetical protein